MTGMELSNYRSILSSLVNFASWFEPNKIKKNMEENNELYFIIERGTEKIPVRNVDNSKFTDALFAPASIQSQLCKSHADDLIYGYVEDEVFYNYPDDKFVEYVERWFD